MPTRADLIEWLDDQRGYSEEIVDALLARWPHIAGPQRMELPDPKAGCICTWHREYDRAEPHIPAQYHMEYEPACPEHSEHLYDPRLGQWIHRPDNTEPKE